MNSTAAPFQHGHIACGTISVGDLDRAVDGYQKWLSQEVVETGLLSTDLAVAWGASAVANARYAIVQPPGNALSSIRLVEIPQMHHTPAVSLGWNAFEITVKDVFALADHLEASPFDIVGPPKEVDGFTSFIPMQVFGPDGEVLFLNQVRHSDADTELPIAESAVGEIFIVVLASPDREASAQQHAQLMTMDVGATHSLRYGLINRAFNYSADTQQTITMVQKGRAPYLQVDQYPEGALRRSTATGGLPMGNAMVSVLVDSLGDALMKGGATGPVVRPEGCVYQGRPACVVTGLAGELIELIEIGHDV